MTGDEFFSLRRGSNVTVQTPFSYFTKGQVLRVEYIDSIHQQVFLRDTTKSLGSQVKIVDTFFMLEFFTIGGKLPEKKNNKILELPFAVGDKVWFMQNNEAHEGTIVKCIITIDINTGMIMHYSLLYTSKFNHEENAYIVSNKLFKTKEELLKSL